MEKEGNLFKREKGVETVEEKEIKGQYRSYPHPKPAKYYADEVNKLCDRAKFLKL